MKLNRASSCFGLLLMLCSACGRYDSIDAKLIVHKDFSGKVLLSTEGYEEPGHTPAEQVAATDAHCRSDRSSLGAADAKEMRSAGISQIHSYAIRQSPTRCNTLTVLSFAKLVPALRELLEINAHPEEDSAQITEKNGAITVQAYRGKSASQFRAEPNNTSSSKHFFTLYSEVPVKEQNASVYDDIAKSFVWDLSKLSNEGIRFVLKN